jgi:hypothetical protein
MGVTGNTELTATKNDLIVALVQKELISEGVLAPTVLDVSRFAGKGMKSISFPKAGSFTVENRATGVAATTQNLTFAADKMDLEFRATVAWLIDSMDALQSSVEVEGEYATRAARAHAVYLEQKIIAELEAVGVANSDCVGDISDPCILSMRKNLIKRKANKNRLSLAIAPDQEAIMLQIPKFVEAYKYGDAIVKSGALGMIYGVPVYVSNELAAQQYFMYDAEGCAIGFQRGPVMDERKAPEYGAGSQLKVLDQLFGVQGLQLGYQGVQATESALVEKDSNA